VAGPLSNDVLPQIFAGGELGHDPFGAGNAVDVGDGWVVVGAAVVGAVVAVGPDVGGAVVVGAVVVGAVVVAALVAGAVVLVGVGDGLADGVTPLLAIVKRPRRLDVEPSDHVSTALMECEPSASLLVS
jgi:hypothetical protein